LAPSSEKYRPPRVSPVLPADVEPTPLDLGALNSDLLPAEGAWQGKPYVRLRDPDSGVVTSWRKTKLSDGNVQYWETQTLTIENGVRLITGLPQGPLTND